MLFFLSIISLTSVNSTDPCTSYYPNTTHCVACPTGQSLLLFSNTSTVCASTTTLGSGAVECTIDPFYANQKTIATDNNIVYYQFTNY